MKYHLHHIIPYTGGVYRPGTADPYFSQLLLDSRKLIFPGESVFFALRGRRDGHQFVPELYEKGVRNFVVSDEPGSNFPEANFVLVPDTLVALQALVAHHRSLFSYPVIGITGSNGKTIVKEWLNQVLEERYNVVRSPRSYNSQIGVPLSVWQMNELNDLAIFEAGISRPGEMDKLESIIRPDIGIFTNIGPAHDEGFEDQRRKASEKAILFRNASIIVFCTDHALVTEALNPYQNKTGVTLFGWGSSGDAALNIRDIHIGSSATNVRASYQAEQFDISIPFTDQASIENALHCWATLLAMGLEREYIGGRMQQLTAVAMRLELKHGINHCSIINDAYNADLASLEIALDFLARQKQHVRRTVILSDILESGQPADLLYREVARAMKQRSVDRLIGIGETIGHYQELFKEAGIPDTGFYPSVDAFRSAFPHLHFSNEAILLKGARVFALEALELLLEEKVHQTIMEIDLDALVHNLHQYQTLLKPGTKVMAMVKAFSYGSGSYEIANVLQFHKVDYLAVAYTDEGIELRKGGIHLPVMVMNADSSSFEALVQYDLEPVIYSMNLLDRFQHFLQQEGITGFPVHIELETGMHRLGFDPSQLNELIRKLLAGTIHVRSLFTHLVASEDAKQDAFTDEQARQFLNHRNQLITSLGYPVISHISNSSGISRHADIQLDMVRLGIGLYGIDPSGALELREVSTLKSTIAQIKHLEPGDTVGYGRRGVISRSSVIATVRIGYADGYPRSLSNGVGKMLAGGHLAPVIGVICMDMTMIDITGIEGVKEGDEVIVFGPELPVSQVAHWAGTIPYELLTGISQRVKRVYFQE